MGKLIHIHGHHALHGKGTDNFCIITFLENVIKLTYTHQTPEYVLFVIVNKSTEKTLTNNQYMPKKTVFVA